MTKNIIINTYTFDPYIILNTILEHYLTYHVLQNIKLINSCCSTNKEFHQKFYKLKQIIKKTILQLQINYFNKFHPKHSYYCGIYKYIPKYKIDKCLYGIKKFCKYESVDGQIIFGSAKIWLQDSFRFIRLNNNQFLFDFLTYEDHIDYKIYRMVYICNIDFFDQCIKIIYKYETLYWNTLAFKPSCDINYWFSTPFKII